MEQNFAVAIMFTVIVVAITTLIVAVLNYRIKTRMIKSGLIDESTAKAFSNSFTNFQFDTLKWGIILFFGAVGLILLNYIPYKSDSTLPYGIEMAFLSAGFITYYYISKKEMKN
ncbi:DUF6249 domain-containing protein [Mucilaginibacter sp. KACC 22063]|uniref:DUF6249 domain-containing protein n=1 Tax=Mucilaginibacter sp. KACC 22063 TaxID=3025666 RepID=UPI0023672E5E|nr:DUF6249 domain-containing protein [Mucilaginibacter sp. KACC 22063]WDF56219.1 hypothetical protein PQ461_03990 [Mucilaginibacter sp. KACC 22063]